MPEVKKTAYLATGVGDKTNSTMQCKGDTMLFVTRHSLSDFVFVFSSTNK